MEGMSAVARAALEYLADRHKSAIEVATIADWIGKPLPKVQAALVELREAGMVRYFKGHPGAWAIAPTGYAEIDAATASVDRYKMALEAILAVGQGHHPEVRLAKTALGR